jgi:CheY-like chemotaxis protein
MSKILVIEDEPDQNKLIKLRLEARGFRVIAVTKAKEGIELARQERPDLILMDMILPDMHGLDATIKIKQNPETKNIPILALSAVGSPDFLKACLQEGISAYIRKPYDPRELFKTIEKYVQPPSEDKKVKPKTTPLPAVDFQRKLKEIEKQFKEVPAAGPPGKKLRPEREAKHKHKIDELLKGVLSDFQIPGEKKAEPEKLKTEAAPAGSPAKKAKAILIIDDDKTFGRIVADFLTIRGYEVDLARDGVNGLKRAFEKRPDLILLSMTLPGGGGEAVLFNLRRAPATGGTPVFIMSSLLSPKNLEEKTRELGAQGFIAKPIGPEDLLYIIESVVGA